MSAVRHVTEAEFYASVPDVFAELFDGEVLVSPAASFRHQRVLGRLYEALVAWSRRMDEPHTVLFSPVDLWLGQDRILQPDLLVFAGALPDDLPSPVHARPQLVAEVLSPSSREYDRRTKRLAYAAAGIAEYWVVDADAGQIERYTGLGLTERTVHDTHLRATSLPDCEVGVASVLHGA